MMEAVLPLPMCFWSINALGDILVHTDFESGKNIVTINDTMHEFEVGSWEFDKRYQKRVKYFDFYLLSAWVLIMQKVS